MTLEEAEALIGKTVRRKHFKASCRIEAVRDGKVILTRFTGGRFAARPEELTPTQKTAGRKG